MFEPLSGFTDPKCTGHTDTRTDFFFIKTPSDQFLSPREQQKKLKLWNFLSIPIDAQPRGGNRQTAKGFCILYSFFRFVVERFESVYQLRMRVYLCTNLGVHKDQL